MASEWLIFDALARNWAMVLIISTIITLIVVPCLVLRKYVRISLNIMRTTKPPLARNPLDFDRILGEPVSFPALDGLPVNAMLLKPQAATARGMIVFAHEYCSDLYSCARYCRPLLEAGYDILTFDFRGHGQTECPPDYQPRQWVTDRELADMRGAIAYAEQYLAEAGRPVELGLVGISRGGGTAILLAAENPRIRAIAVDGAFSTDTTIEYFMRRWAYIFAGVQMNWDAYPDAFWRFLRFLMIRYASHEFGCRFPSVRKAIARMTPRPILFIHGEKDSYLPVEQSRLLYALAAQPKYLWVAPRARHNQAAIVHPERYADLTVKFFDRHLSRPADGPAGTPLDTEATVTHTAQHGPDARPAIQV